MSSEKRPLVDDDAPTQKKPLRDDEEPPAPVPTQQQDDSEAELGEPQRDGRPAILVNKMDADTQRDLLVDRLLTLNVPPKLFVRGHTLTEIVTDESTAPYLSAVGPARLRNRLASNARFMVVNKTESTTPPSSWLVKLILDDHDSLRRFPPVNRIVEVPVFAASAALQTTPGYHKASRTFYAPAPGLEIPPVSEHPSDEERTRARRLIYYELLADFPFVSLADKAHAIALLLLPFARDLIDGQTPLHMIEAPTPGTGKSLLAHVLLYPALGRPLKRTPDGESKAEWRTKLAALLLEARPVIFIDNLSQHLDSPVLSALIADEGGPDRRRGPTKIIDAENRSVWVATGNNPTESGELGRRSERIRLDSGLERPDEERNTADFLHPDIKAWVAEHRADLVWAALTLISAWLGAGRPPAGTLPAGLNPADAWMVPAAPPLKASFEDWSRTMAGILHHAGIPGFRTNRAECRPTANEPEHDAALEFIQAWANDHQQDPVTASRLLSTAVRYLDLEGTTEHARKVSLGLWLIRHKDQKIGDYYIRQTKGDTHANVNRWRLLRAPLGKRRGHDQHP